MGPPTNVPPPRNSPPHNSPPRNSPPRNSPPPNLPGPAREGDISKSKPDITYDGRGDINAFFFGLKQSLSAYNLNTPVNQLLGFGRSLREGALNWWRLSHGNYNTLQDAAAGLETAFRDKSKPLDHVRKINNLIQTSSIHNFFLEIDRLNIQAQLPDDALWKTLRGNLKPALHTALAFLRPKSATYHEWRQAALEIGFELDAESHTNNNNHRSSKKRPQDRKDKDEAPPIKKRKNGDRGYVSKEDQERRKERGDCMRCGVKGHNAKNCRTGWQASPTPQKSTARTTPKIDKKGKKKDTGTLKVAELGRDDTTTAKITELDSGEDTDSGKE